MQLKFHELQRQYLRWLSSKAKPYLKSYGLLQTVKFYNRSSILWEPEGKEIIVLAPHMDDEIIGCGGTIYKHLKKGSNVTIVFLTDGRNGSYNLSRLSGAERQQEELNIVKTRKIEAEAALNTLGIKNKIYLDAESYNLSSTLLIQNLLKDILLSVKPDIVYLPFFLEEHPDHRATSQILVDATENLNINFTCAGYEIWTPLFPNCLVKIDDVVEIKKQALECYISQLTDKDFIHSILGLNAYRSITLLDRSINYVEAFLLTSLVEYRKLFKNYCKSDKRNNSIRKNKLIASTHEN
jgi:LmbE family N-acetylglucosaminyl deacetylase